MMLYPRIAMPSLHNPFSLLMAATLLVISLWPSPQASASINLWQEKQHSDQLVKLIPQRQIRWLPTSPETLALRQTSHATKVEGTALILPAPGEHPDQKPIIHGLRHQLLDHGWSTLSLQMPVIDEAISDDLLSLYDASKPRLDAAINLITKENPKAHIIIIGHGFSASVAVHYLRNNKQLFNQNGDSRIKGLIAISLPGREASGNWLDSTEQLQELTLPILDIYAEHDRRDVLQSAAERLKASHIAGRANQRAASPRTAKVRELALNKTGNPLYRQHRINSARTGFPQQNHFLIKAIRSWLEENPR